MNTILPSLMLVFSIAEVSAEIPASYADLGNQCTIIYARHGEKPDGKDYLTETGKIQAEQLAQTLVKFESDYRKISQVIHSNLQRSIQTAEPFKKKRPGVPVAGLDMQKLMRECDTSEVQGGVCRQKAGQLKTELIKNYCLRNLQGSPTAIFATGHGSIGYELLKLMVGRNCPMRFAEPYVIAVSNNGKISLVHGRCTQ